MGKYSSHAKQQPPKFQRGQIHPVMRGIGCVLFAIVPPLAYIAAVELVKYGTGRWSIPVNWLGYPTIPAWLYRLQGLQTILDFIGRQNNLTANIVFAIALMVLIFGVLSMLYGFMFRLMGPSQYGPTDEPPIRTKVKRYKR